ncbi:hypothetical protein NW801_22205 [Brevibacillus laterosporus]|uniref:Uncharacterized protein n=1 Tax=Brevibacillus halotolerans TaxID=1507437 RepID=A0ABT4I314_9BACL|nr:MULTISPECIES: hypothetical protein [Brevibacillus]MCR8987707.1 hypothetical protein [Brevibacillus laterosporus]MCZ0833446.1 hypothetical protein [Brevibacillus halotolerans]
MIRNDGLTEIEGMNLKYDEVSKWERRFELEIFFLKQREIETKTDIVIREHAHSEDHLACIVTTKRGFSYGCSWAIERDERGQIISPTKSQIEKAWKTDRSNFFPFIPNSY